MVLHSDSGMKTRAQCLIQTVARYYRFEEWLKSAKSGTLVISTLDPNVPGVDTISPLSYLCAVLAKLARREIPRAVPLTFFCGLYADPSNGTMGPAIMMRTLIAQLALAHAEDSGLTDFFGPMHLQRTQNGDIEALCQVFSGLIDKIGQCVIICMIDGINFIDWRIVHDTMKYLNRLVDIVGEGKKSVVFKLLVTSPVTGGKFKYWSPERSELFVSRGTLRRTG